MARRYVLMKSIPETRGETSGEPTISYGGLRIGWVERAPSVVSSVITGSLGNTMGCPEWAAP